MKSAKAGRTAPSAEAVQGKSAGALVVESLAPLFKRAEAEGLWFHCGYQNLWFSPKQLKAEHDRGRFIWGAVNWTLRDPKVRLAQLEKHADSAAKEVGKFAALIAAESQS